MSETDPSAQGAGEDSPMLPPAGDDHLVFESLASSQPTYPQGTSEDSPMSPPVTDEPPPSEASQSDDDQQQPRATIIVRYGLMRQIGEFRHDLEPAPVCGTQVVVRTERGVELGEVIAGICKEPRQGKVMTPEHLNDFIKNNGADFPFRRGGKLLRLANHQDMIDHRHLDSSGREETIFCREKIREMKLAMKLVAVEHLLGGGRIIFYFASEGRVDFRDLVRMLASQYHTRIEMRQVGARDEARLVADYERCGQRCCCQQFIKDLRPVAMRMAKTQKATLDPSKISGRCGRLMCCLRFEDETYAQLRKTLPNRNTWVRTAEIAGKVVDTQIITQLVRVMVSDGSVKTIGVEEILERSVTAPAQPEQTQPPSGNQAEARRARGNATETRRQRPTSKSNAPRQSPQREADNGDNITAAPPQPKRRGRHNQSRDASPEAAAQAQGQPPATDSLPEAVATGEQNETQAEQNKTKKRHRRGRRGRRTKRPPTSE